MRTADVPAVDRRAGALAQPVVPVEEASSSLGVASDADGRRLIRAGDLARELQAMVAASLAPLRKGAHVDLELSVSTGRGAHMQRRRFVIGGE